MSSESERGPRRREFPHACQRIQLLEHANLPYAGWGHAERKQIGRETSRTVGKQRTPRHRGGGVISTTLKGCLCSLPSRSLSRPSLFFLHTTAKRGCACRPKQQSSKGRLASRFIRHRSCSNDASCSIWEYHHITERAADRARLPCGTRRRWTRPWPWGADTARSLARFLLVLES